MTSDRDQLAELIGAVLQGIDQTEIPEHRMIVHGGACGSCGQMPHPPTEEDLALLRTALARIERDNGERIGLDEFAKEMGVDLDG